MELNLKAGKFGFNIKMGRSGGPLQMGSSSGDLGVGATLTGRNRWFGLLPGATVDYDTLAGDKWRNSIIAAGINWFARNLPQAPPCCLMEDAQGVEHVIPHHPLTQLRKRPNPFYDGRTLMQATFLSLIAGRGNAYWYIVRDQLGNPMQLWYIPHFQIWPIWDDLSDTNSWITGYAYRQGGITIKLKFEDVLHMREGLDPYNQRSGLDPVGSGAREIVSDNENAGLTVSLLRNMAMPPLIISPKDGQVQFGEGDAETLKAQIEENSGGDNRFRPIVLDGSVTVDKISLTPEEMMLDKTPNRWEARLCALIGINPVVLGLWSGLERSTYSNMEEAIRSAWTEGAIPRLELINSEIDTQLLPFFDNRPNVRAGNDYKRVRALQDNENDLYKRLTGAIQGPWMTPNEGRAIAGMDATPGGDKLADPAGEVTAARDNRQVANDSDATKRLKAIRQLAIVAGVDVAEEPEPVPMTNWAQRALDELAELASA